MCTYKLCHVTSWVDPVPPNIKSTRYPQTLKIQAFSSILSHNYFSICLGMIVSHNKLTRFLETSVPLLRGCSYPGKNSSFPGKNMLFPARIQNSRGAIVLYRILTYLVGRIFENINVIFFGKFPLNLTLDFLNLTKCNFRRHFGGCLVKKHGISCV